MAKVLQRTQGVDAAARAGRGRGRPGRRRGPDAWSPTSTSRDGRVEEAFTRLVELVRVTADKERDRAREHLIGLFAAVGNDDPRVLPGAITSPRPCSDAGVAERGPPRSGCAGAPASAAGAACAGAWTWCAVMWRQRPGLLLLGMVPAFLVLLVLVAAFIALVLHLGRPRRLGDPVRRRLVGAGARRDAVLRRLALVVGSVLLAAATFTALTLAVGDPFYERIWRETEAGARRPGAGGRGRASALARRRRRPGGARARDDAGVVLVGLVPVVGTVAALVGGFCLSAWFLAGELLGPPARGARPGRPRAVPAAARPPAQVLGFGMSVQACFLVPLGAVLVMPAAVVGATMLARDLVEA